MTIQVLGTGCAKCKALYANAEAAVSELGIEATITKVDDLREIIKLGVMTTPALAVDGQVKVAGRVATVADIKKMLA